MCDSQPDIIVKLKANFITTCQNKCLKFNLVGFTMVNILIYQSIILKYFHFLVLYTYICIYATTYWQR